MNLSKDKEKKLYEIFIQVDDFCLALYDWKKVQGISSPVRCSAHLSDSEIMSIVIFYHYSGYKCFQYYYEEMVLLNLDGYFPRAVSYSRFLCHLLKVLPGLYVYLKYCTLSSCRTGTYFIDSKKLVVCKDQRAKQNRVFEGLAAWGKSSMGWFFGLKLHFVINERGEMINFVLSSGNVADNNHEILRELLQNLQGECYGDRGYLTQLFEQFYEKGLVLITHIKKKMKNKLLKLEQKLKLRKRGIIESVNDILTSVMDIEHSRHRNPYHALCHILGGLIAYHFYEQKPAVFVPKQDKLIVA